MSGEREFLDALERLMPGYDFGKSGFANRRNAIKAASEDTTPAGGDGKILALFREFMTARCAARAFPDNNIVDDDEKEREAAWDRAVKLEDAIFQRLRQAQGALRSKPISPSAQIRFR